MQRHQHQLEQADRENRSGDRIHRSDRQAHRKSPLRKGRHSCDRNGKKPGKGRGMLCRIHRRGASDLRYQQHSCHRSPDRLHHPLRKRHRQQAVRSAAGHHISDCGQRHGSDSEAGSGKAVRRCCVHLQHGSIRHAPDRRKDHRAASNESGLHERACLLSGKQARL